MTRLPPTPTEPDDPRLRAIFEEVEGRIHRIPTLYRVIGHAPEMLRAWIDFAWPLRLAATTSRGLRELMILRGALLADVDYEWAHHVPMALEAGVSREQIDALADPAASPLFSEPERAALRLVDEVTRGPGASREAFEGLRRHFSGAECIELVLTASFYVCVGRFLTSLDVDVEPEYRRHLRGSEKS